MLSRISMNWRSMSEDVTGRVIAVYKGSFGEDNNGICTYTYP